MDTNDEHDTLLKPRFAALRAELETHSAPPGVEKELMDAFRKRHVRRWYQRLPLGGWGMAGLGSACAAGLVLIVALQASRPGTAPGALPVVMRDDGTAFIALESLERIESEPSPQLVEAELSGSALAEAGVPVAPERAGQTVRAEMLVAADGQPLAVRLTPNN